MRRTSSNMLLVGREHSLTSTKRSHGSTHLHSQIQSLRKRKHLIIVIIIELLIEHLKNLQERLSLEVKRIRFTLSSLREVSLLPFSKERNKLDN